MFLKKTLVWTVLVNLSNFPNLDLSFLSSLPQFQMMRNQIRQHPESLPQLLQEIGQANPQLLTVRLE